MTTCTECLATWGGLRTAHCATCHTTFAGITAFDRHRSGPRSARCVAPADAGLALNAFGYWGTNTEEDITT